MTCNVILNTFASLSVNSVKDLLTVRYNILAMAKALKIKAEHRENKKPNALRSSGFIPATIYGHGFDSKSIQINAKEFLKVPYKAYSHINELELDGEKHPVIIRDVQVDPVKDNYLNIQFYRIRSDEKIKVKVPLNYVGHSPAVTAGGVIIVSLNEIEIQCLPIDIPDAIDINLEQILEIGQGVQAKDLKVSEKIQILARPEELLVKVEVAKTHEIEEVAPEAAISAEAPTAEAAVAAEGAAAAPAPGSKEAKATGGKETKAPAKEAKAPDAKPEKGKEK